MGLATVDLKSPDLTQLNTISMSLESGTLIGLCLIDPSSSASSASAYAELGIMIDGTEATNIGVVLIDGYVSANNLVGWTGRIDMEPGYFVYARFLTVENVVYRLNALTT